MDKARFAERILAAVTPRAAAITGDLLEQNLSGPAFLFAVLRVTLGLSWRWIPAYVGACVSFMIAFVPYTHFSVARYGWHMGAAGPLTKGYVLQPERWQVWGVALLIAAVTFLSATTLSLVRFGPRSPLSRTGGVLSLLTLTASCLAWAPYAVFTIPVSLVLAFAVLLRSRTGRRAVITLAGAGGLSLIFMFVSQGVYGDLMRHFHLSVSGLVLTCLWWLAVLVESITLSALHSKVMNAPAKNAYA